MTQENMITAGIVGFLALILLYLTLKMRLVATSGETESRSVSQIEYQMAQLGAWMDYSMSAIGRMLLLAFIFIAPLVALGPKIFGDGKSGFSFRGYFYGVALILIPTLIVARRSFNEGRYGSPTSDMKYALQRAAKSNRSIFLMAFLAAILYAALIAGALMILGLAWWAYALILIGILFASLIVMIGLSD